MAARKASRRVPLSRATITAYRSAGWEITVHERPDAGATTGPCVTCREPRLRYGPNGHAECQTYIDIRAARDAA